MTMLQAARAGSFHVVHLPAADDFDFWRRASQSALDSIWGNEADDIYAELDKE